MDGMRSRRNNGCFVELAEMGRDMSEMARIVPRTMEEEEGRVFRE